MLISFTTLFCITLISFLSPFLSYITGGKVIRASAIIILLGWLFGPNMLGFIHPEAYGIPLLQQLGLAFLFLMGGYSMEYNLFATPAGKHSCLCWVISLGLGLLIAFCGPFHFSPAAGIAFALALTATSLPKVNAELKTKTSQSPFYTQVVESYGASGELLPVCAFALLIGENSPLLELAILGMFVICAFLGRALIAKEDKEDTKLSQFVHDSHVAPFGAEELVIAIMVGLTTLGVILGADMLIAGFAAGYILRRLVKNENDHALVQLKGVANGFFIPLTFVLSGASLNLAAAFAHPGIMVGFLGLLIVIRGLPVLCSLEVFKETRVLDQLQKVSVAAYSCMTMSTIVAMTDVALESGDMTETVAATLIGAAALLNIVMPLVTSFLEKKDAARKNNAS